MILALRLRHLTFIVRVTRSIILLPKLKYDEGSLLYDLDPNDKVIIDEAIANAADDHDD